MADKNKPGKPNGVKPKISRDEIRKKLKADLKVVDTSILRRDPWQIKNPDPDFVYRFARDDALRIQELEFIGYEVAHEKPDPDSPLNVKTTPDSLPPAPPGHVLMRIPREMHEMREAAKDKVLEEHEKDIKAQYEAFKRAVRRIVGKSGYTKLFSDEVAAEDLDDDIQF